MWIYGTGTRILFHAVPVHMQRLQKDFLFFPAGYAYGNPDISYCGTDSGCGMYVWHASWHGTRLRADSRTGMFRSKKLFQEKQRKLSICSPVFPEILAAHRYQFPVYTGNVYT